MVELETKDVQINGDTFTLRKVPAEIGWFMALRIMEANGKSAGALGLAGDVGGMAGMASALGHAQAALAAILRDKSYMAEVVMPLWRACQKNGQPAIGPMWTMDYANDLGTLLLLYQAQVDFNFAGFSSVFGQENGVIAALTTARQADGQAKPTSATDGQSG